MTINRPPIYRSERGYRLIEIKLRDIRQLFNSLDPAPFHEKDLDAAAEEYIVSAVRELRAAPQIKLVFYLPRETQVEEAKSLPDAVHNYFAYREQHTRYELRQLLRYGGISMPIGLAFLFLCLSLRQLAAAMLQSDAARQVLMEGLSIVGWVALWRPLEVFLYEWWPIKRRQEVYAYLASISIEVRSED